MQASVQALDMQTDVTESARVGVYMVDLMFTPCTLNVPFYSHWAVILPKSDLVSYKQDGTMCKDH